MSSPTRIIPQAGIRGMRIDWTPYDAGAGISVLRPLAFAIAADPLGVATPAAAYRA